MHNPISNKSLKYQKNNKNLMNLYKNNNVNHKKRNR